MPYCNCIVWRRNMPPSLSLDPETGLMAKQLEWSLENNGGSFPPAIVLACRRFGRIFQPDCRPEELRGRNRCSGNGSCFRDLCSPEQFHGASWPLHPFPPECLSHVLWQRDTEGNLLGCARDKAWETCACGWGAGGVWGRVYSRGVLFFLFGAWVWPVFSVYLDRRRNTHISSAGQVKHDMEKHPPFILWLCLCTRGIKITVPPCGNNVLCLSYLSQIVAEPFKLVSHVIFSLKQSCKGLQNGKYCPGK